MSDVIAQKWAGRTLTRPSRPFSICEHPFDSSPERISIVCGEEEQPVVLAGTSPDFSIFLNRDQAASLKSITIPSGVDKKKIEKETGIPMSGIKAALILKDFTTRKIIVIGRWPLSELPDELSVDSDKLSEISTKDQFELTVTAFLSADLDKSSKTASRRSSELARINFSFFVEKEDGPSFDISEISPKALVARGCGEDTLVLVQVDDDNLSLPAKDVVHVFVNEKAMHKLSLIQGGANLGKVLVLSIEADILFQVTQAVLAKDYDPEWPLVSLGKYVYDTLSKHTNLEGAAIQSKYRNSPHLLLGLMQSIAGLATAVKDAALTGSAKQ